MAEEVAPFANIVRRVKELAVKHGLVLQKSVFDISDNTKTHPLAQLVFTLDPKFDPKPIDPFDEIVKGEEELERKKRNAAKAEEARQNLEHLRDTLKKPEDGIGL